MNEISSKLKLVLWGKNLQLPMDYDKLKFDRYELKDNGSWCILYIYKNNKKIIRVWYWENGNKEYEYNYKKDGKRYNWYENGNKKYEQNYKDGILDGKQYLWYDNGKLYKEENYKNGELDGKQYAWNSDGNKCYEDRDRFIKLTKELNYKLFALIYPEDKELLLSLDDKEYIKKIIRMNMILRNMENYKKIKKEILKYLTNKKL